MPVHLRKRTCFAQCGQLVELHYAPGGRQWPQSSKKDSRLLCEYTLLGALMYISMLLNSCGSLRCFQMHGTTAPAIADAACGAPGLNWKGAVTTALSVAVSAQKLSGSLSNR
jgi:hypothetical protein